MKLRVKYTAQLRTAVQRAEEVIDMPDGSVLAGLLNHLAERYPAGKSQLLGRSGEIASSLLMAVNETAVSAQDGQAVVLKDGDVVLLLPPIAGG
jgi:MoaD family protein